MTNTVVRAIYFSPTGGTKKIVTQITRALGEKLECDCRTVNFTVPEAREQAPVLSADDVLICAVPVYAGRVPNVLLPYLKSLQGNGCRAAAVVVYGNRHYDDALAELTGLLKEAGCRCVAAAAFISQHVFSEQLAAGRPDWNDIAAVADFSHRLGEKLLAEDDTEVSVPGQYPSPAYYQPRDTDGTPINILKVKPKTGAGCNGCGFCASVCPMGSIDPADPTVVKGVCIKCNACVRRCVRKAKYFDDAGYLRHLEILEQTCRERREPELYL